MWFKNEQHLVYFDIGHRFSKTAVASQKGKSVVIHSTTAIETPPECLRAERPHQPNIFKELIHELTRPIPSKILHGARFMLAAPDANTVLKKIFLPKPLPKDMDNHILYETEQIAPYPIADAMVDYSFLNAPIFIDDGATGKKGAHILLTIAQKSGIRPYTQLFEEMSCPLSYISPASVGLLNLGVKLSRGGDFKDGIIMLHIGHQKTLIVHVAPAAIRSMYYPYGYAQCVRDTLKYCDLRFEEGLFFAERLSQKDIPEIFLSAITNSITRFCEAIGETIVKFSDIPPGRAVPVFLSGGASRTSHIQKCFKRISELNVQPLTFDAHLASGALSLGEAAKADDIATYFPFLIGHLEAVFS